MTVRVKLFAVARELAGRDEIEVELTDGATISDLQKAVAAAAPKLKSVLASSLWAIDAEYSTATSKISENSEVALIPPVSGG